MTTQQRTPGKKWKILANLMIPLGTGLFLFALISYLNGYWLQFLLNKEWEARRAEELKELEGAAMAPQGQSLYSPERGDIVAKLEIPKIKLDTVIIEGIDKSNLERGPGHYPGTAFPGQEGNCVIAAHRDTFFRNVDRLNVNDSIKVSTEGSDYTYLITDKRVVEPTDLTPIAPTPYPALTLITCYPFYYIGPAPKRFIITAQRFN